MIHQLAFICTCRSCEWCRQQLYRPQMSTTINTMLSSLPDAAFVGDANIRNLVRCLRQLLAQYFLRYCWNDCHRFVMFMQCTLNIAINYKPPAGAQGAATGAATEGGAKVVDQDVLGKCYSVAHSLAALPSFLKTNLK